MGCITQTIILNKKQIAQRGYRLVYMENAWFPFSCTCREYIKLTSVIEYVNRSTIII